MESSPRHGPWAAAMLLSVAPLAQAKLVKFSGAFGPEHGATTKQPPWALAFSTR